ISADTLQPGASVTISGDNLVMGLAGTVVSVGGAPATVVSATAGTLRITLAPPTALPCQPTHAVQVTVTTTAGSASVAVPLEVATRTTLARGESLQLTDAAAAACLELGGTGATYIVSVFADGGPGAAAATPFQLVGVNEAAGAGPTAHVGAPVSAAALAPLPAAGPHERVLDAGRALMLRLGRPAWPAARRGVRAAASESAPLPRPGDTLSLKVPLTTDICDSAVAVRARVVEVSARAVMLEDLAAPLPGAADSAYRALAQEFDRVQVGILRANFGDMLKLDPRGWGRVMMLFTPRVNAAALEGYAPSSDLYPASRCPASNQALIFYAAVPTTLTELRSTWGGYIGATMIHEAKHVTSAVEHLSRAAAPEESWLEEGSAVIAQELWARQVFGYAQLGNTGYAASLRCEVAGAWDSACAGKPRPLLDRMLDLTKYMGAVEGHTPLGPASPGDWTFYGGAWALLRWASDQLGAGDAAFFSALTQSGSQTGIANLEARTGQSFKALLARFTLTLATSNYPDLIPADPRLRFPSWNLPDVLAGLNRDWPAAFPTARPLQQHIVPSGSFTADNAGIRAGSAAYYVVSGAQAPQLLRLAAPGGAPAPSNLGVAILRVQ
ncbi:MAG TPA: IPT/TIG domain-containing protein, partial [Longimicrobiales bacterium]